MADETLTTQDAIPQTLPRSYTIPKETTTSLPSQFDFRFYSGGKDTLGVLPSIIVPATIDISDLLSTPVKRRSSSLPAVLRRRSLTTSLTKEALLSPGWVASNTTTVRDDISECPSPVLLAAEFERPTVSSRERHQQGLNAISSFGKPDIQENTNDDDDSSSDSDSDSSDDSSHVNLLDLNTNDDGKEAKNKTDEVKVEEKQETIEEVLEDVKKLSPSLRSQFRAIMNRVKIWRLQGLDLKAQHFNLVLQGDPGRGQGEVTKLFARYLWATGVLTSIEVTVENQASIVRSDFSRLNDSHKGGVMFISEAHELSRSDREMVEEQINEYLGKIVVALDIPNEHMESFSNENGEFLDCFPFKITFGRLEESDLVGVLSEEIKKRYGSKMEIEGGFDGRYIHIAIKRLMERENTTSSDLISSAKHLVSLMSRRQEARLLKDLNDLDESDLNDEPADVLKFTKEDILGLNPHKAKESKAWKKLQSMIGLQSVKDSVRIMFDTVEANYERELEGSKIVRSPLNRVFVGDPGTGKTSVAKLYGQVLADAGLLSNGEVVIKNPSDFVGEYEGTSEAKTREILKSTLGKVLIIDEAYMLHSPHNGSRRKAVVDTLVAEIQGIPGDDRCVILLGYENELKEMFENVNPGLYRRFGFDNPFRFENYNADELLEIFKFKMKLEELDATPEALKVAKDVLDRTRMRADFSNAAEADSLLSRAKEAFQKRQNGDYWGKASKICFNPEDIDPDYKDKESGQIKCRELLQGKIPETAIRKLEKYQRMAMVAQRRGSQFNKEVPTNFIFKGPPGTGKTETARAMGKIFYKIGYLSSFEVVECSARDLIAEYYGQTVHRTQKQLQRALGKVFIVDDAHRLQKGQYEQEAITEIIHLIGSPKYHRKIIVILAGDAVGMDQLLRSTPGLSSWFSNQISFENIDPKTSMTLLHNKLKEADIVAPFLVDERSEGYASVFERMRWLSQGPIWGNARDIYALAADMIDMVRDAEFESIADGTMDVGQSDGIRHELGVKQAEMCMVAKLDEQRRIVHSYSRMRTGEQYEKEYAKEEEFDASAAGA